ncbi:hypothetical protein [Candidatus Protochlamydia sp. R18]|uniref:hypothetical protein n=1 Tax=Candidatus Protochlamydia sp. R18 TaxID=1353977 RepID=UPI0005A8DA11|nr:hypothetical protein [Candidatus Protochlamydia sp. R18]
MVITATFIDGRCFFNDFNPDNDRNPITGKVGLNYCRYQFIGAILEFFGFTYSIHCEHGKCYIYENSLKNWIIAHEKDLNKLSDTAKKINSLIAEQYIKEICENRRQKIEYRATHDVNPGEPLSYDEIIKKAETEFAEHPNKNEVLDTIKKRLGFYRYTDQIKRRLYPSFTSGAIPWYINMDEDYPIFRIAEQFLKSLPGIDKIPYEGEVIQ